MSLKLASQRQCPIRTRTVAPARTKHAPPQIRHATKVWSMCGPGYNKQRRFDEHQLFTCLPDSAVVSTSTLHPRAAARPAGVHHMPHAARHINLSRISTSARICLARPACLFGVEGGMRGEGKCHGVGAAGSRPIRTRTEAPARTVHDVAQEWYATKVWRMCGPGYDPQGILGEVRTARVHARRSRCTVP